ncbi:hypothetical protein GOP47_0029615, partial [Adiantum capillus-veneris]
GGHAMGIRSYYCNTSTRNMALKYNKVMAMVLASLLLVAAPLAPAYTMAEQDGAPGRVLASSTGAMGVVRRGLQSPCMCSNFYCPAPATGCSCERDCSSCYCV